MHFSGFTLETISTNEISCLPIFETWVTLLADWGGEDTRRFENRSSLYSHPVSFSALRWNDL